MSITVDSIHDLARWAYSKSCNGWRANRHCLDRDTGEELPEPHPGCVAAQRATDLLNAMRRYDGDPVIGWLVDEAELDPELWQ